MPSKPKVKIGDVVCLAFDDHVEGSDRVEEYLVFGRVAAVTKKSIVVDSWALKDPSADRELDRENIKTFTILRRVINEITVYAPAV